MTDYFISYGRKDGSEFADRLHDDLEADDYDAWFDVRDIVGGTTWDKVIEDALNECQVVLLIITPESMASDNVRNEWSYVINEKPIISLMFIQADLPMRLKDIQYIDFTTSYDSGIAKLRKLLKSLKKKMS